MDFYARQKQEIENRDVKELARYIMHALQKSQGVEFRTTWPNKSSCWWVEELNRGSLHL